MKILTLSISILTVLSALIGTMILLKKNQGIGSLALVLVILPLGGTMAAVANVAETEYDEVLYENIYSADRYLSFGIGYDIVDGEVIYYIQVDDPDRPGEKITVSFFENETEIIKTEQGHYVRHLKEKYKFQDKYILYVPTEARLIIYNG